MDPDMALAFQALTAAITALPAQMIAANAAAKRGAAEGEGAVSAFDRPQPVIVMGPNPLPVSGMGGGNEKKEPKEKEDKGGGGILGRLIGPLIAKFAAVIGPMAILGAVVGNAASGFGTMMKAVNLFASTLTPIIMPVAILIATAFTAVADVLSSSLPGMQGFVSLIISMGIPAIVAVVDALMWLAKQAKWIADNMPDPDKGDFFGGATDWLAKQFIGVGNDLGIYSDEETRMMSESIDSDRAASRGGESDTRRMVMSALGDVVKSFTMSVGPKAQISGLESVRQSVQMAALNQDPLEAKMLRVQQQIAEMLNKALTGMSGGVYTPGGVGFEGSGAGGSAGGSF